MIRLGPTQQQITIASLAERLGVSPSPLGVEVTIKAVKKAQTDTQRGYYWLSLHAFGKHIGYTAKEAEMYLHNAVLCECYGVAETRRIRGALIEIPNKRSSKANRDEYSELIETLIYFAAQQGFAIQQPRAAA